MMTEELDFEAEIPVSSSTNVKIVNEVEYSTQNAVKKELVTEKATGDLKSDSYKTNCETGVGFNTRELESNKGNVKSGVRKVKSDTGGVKCDTEKVESQSDAGEVESDTGEILNDDLEEGELEDINTQTKTSEVICRYYQRGTCLYGSYCRNLHPTVYNMFDPVLSNRSNFKSFELQNFNKPPVYQPYPIMPDIESSWERGIKMAKVVMQNVNFKKQSEDLDIENDWEKCLAEAKANIQKASFKRKTNDIEKPYFNSNYSKQEKFRERSPMKREYDINFKQKYSKNYYSKHENESNYENRAKPFDVKPTQDHLQFVDPWRRSKSPRKRTRSMSSSISPSPRRTRDRSASSSSSSCIAQIYGHTHRAKSARRKSRSRSVSPHSKKSKSLKAHLYNKKTRSYSYSVSRSFSKSPRKRTYSSSSSSDSSAKSYDRKKPYYKESKLKTSSRINEIKSCKRYTSSERSMNASLPSTTKPTFKKTCRRSSSPSNSDNSSAGSYLSYTSVSSLSGVCDFQTTYSEEREGKYFSKTDLVPQDRKIEETFKPNKKDLGNNQLNSRTFCGLSGDLDVSLKQKKPLSDASKLQIPSETSIKFKFHSDKFSGSQKTSNPTMVKKLTNQNSAEAALLMYHSFGRTKDNANSSLVIKSSQAKDISLPLEATKSKKDNYSKVPITKEVASKSTPDVQFKSQPIKINISAANIKKEAVSKRKMLLQQLQAVEDAIARKKQPS